MRMRWRINRVDIDLDKMSVVCTKAEKDLAQQVFKDTREYVPFREGVFDRRSRVIGNIIEYSGNMVNYLWEGKKMVNAATGKGPRIIPDVGPRWPKYATLAPTSIPLKYTHDFHSKAQDHWMDASMHDNMKKWADIAEEAIANGYNHY